MHTCGYKYSVLVYFRALGEYSFDDVGDGGTWDFVSLPLSKTVKSYEHT